MHFFSPANVMKLLEVVRGEKTAKDVLVTVMQLAKKIKKTAVVSGVCDGFIGNRMIEQYLRQALLPARRRRVAAAGRPRAGEVRHGDGAVPHGRPGRQRHRLGHPQAPLRREADMSSTRRSPTGCASWAASARRPAPAGTTTSRASATRFPIRSVDDDDRRAIARSIGIDAAQDRRRGDRRALLYALVNEGARILEEGIALRASDIDMVYLTGYGFPLVSRRPDALRRHGRPLQRRAQR